MIMHMVKLFRDLPLCSLPADYHVRSGTDAQTEAKSGFSGELGFGFLVLVYSSMNININATINISIYRIKSNQIKSNQIKININIISVVCCVLFSRDPASTCIVFTSSSILD